MRNGSVKNFVDTLQATGRYSFDKKETYEQLGISPDAIQTGLKRLVRKKRIASPRRGFYVMVPLEYRNSGIIPIPWFIHQLMAFMGRPYYVGLLSAAALHGAAHQQPQVFHVVSSEQIRNIDTHGIRIHFFSKEIMQPEFGIIKIKTETGYMNVSNPEMTAIDLVRHAPKVGGLNFISTVLLELSEKMKSSELLNVAKVEKSPVYLQRLGYILDHLGKGRLTAKLNQWLLKKECVQIPLLPGVSTRNAYLNTKWNLLINKKIEVDEL